MPDDPNPVERRVDEEVLGERGTTVSEGALDEEEHPEMHPRSPGELARKVKSETEEGEGVVDKTKRAFGELDRDIAGEYERREDPTAPSARPEDDR